MWSEYWLSWRKVILTSVAVTEYYAISIQETTFLLSLDENSEPESQVSERNDSHL